MNRNYDIKLLLCFVVFVLIGCGEQYSFQLFTFPNDIPAHENGWRYKGKVLVSTRESGSMFRISDKKVIITIIDSEKNELFTEFFHFDSVADIRTMIDWEKINNLQINLLEKGNNKFKDGYSKELIKNGNRLLSSLRYEINEKENTIKKRNQ